MSDNNHLPKFSESIKKKWIVKRDEAGDEFIRLNGKQALLNEGIDHIYLISPERVGVWLTGRQLKPIQRVIPGLKVEQCGEGEIILSCSIEHLDKLCIAVGVRKRRPVSDETRKRLRSISPFLKPDSLIKTANQRPNKPEKLESGQ